MKKHNLDLKVSKDYIFYINHYAKELNSNIATWIQEDNIVHIPFPDIQNIFPAHKLCYGYEELRSQILKSFDSKIKNSSFETIGIEVAARNRYNLDRKLSNKNSKICNSKRKVLLVLAKIVFIYLSILKMAGLKYMIRIKNILDNINLMDLLKNSHLLLITSYISKRHIKCLLPTTPTIFLVDTIELLKNYETF